MTEILMLPEMLQAGVEALTECEESGADRKTTVIQVCLAVEAVRMMLCQPDEGSVH